MSRYSWPDEVVRTLIFDNDAPVSLKVFLIMYKNGLWGDNTRMSLIELIGRPKGFRPWNLVSNDGHNNNHPPFGDMSVWFPPNIFGSFDDAIDPSSATYSDVIEWRSCYDLLFEQLFEQSSFSLRKTLKYGLGLYSDLNNQSLEYQIIPNIKGII